MDTVTVYKDKAGEWRWTRTAENGHIIADSGEGYNNRVDCVAMAAKVNVSCRIQMQDDD